MRLLSFLLLLVSFSSLAQVESLINFRGQNAETISVDKSVNVTRPVPYQVPDTCYNQIPYQSYECRDVTRYRQQCTWIPASQRCWTENDRVCRNVTRTRQECHNGPSRQVCTERPSRQVCTERPTREVCRTDSNGQQRCTTVGGGQSCQTVGGGQSCTTVPGERICRDVSYTDQECHNVPRQRCETVPGRNDCRDIPYSEEVCGYETRYRAEPYACQRTEYRDETKVKQLKGAIQVQFITNGLVEEFPLLVQAGAVNAKFEKFEIMVKLQKDPQALVMLRNKKISAQENETEIVLDGEVVIEVIDPKTVAPVFPTQFKGAVFDENKELLSLSFEGPISAIGTIETKIVANPKIGRNKTVVELKASYPSERVTLQNDKLVLNLSRIMQNDLVKRNEVTLKLTAPLAVEGELLNSVKPQMDKSYSFEFKK